MGKIYKYLRVSTKHQDNKRQDMIFDSMKITFDRVFTDDLTGKDRNRPQLELMLALVEAGDQIYVESISRLGRNVDDLRDICAQLEKKDVVVHFVKEGFNTSGSHYKFMLTILGAVAEMERELIVERTREGMEKAKKYGTKSGKAIGRPEATIPEGFEKVYKLYSEGKITQQESANMLKVSRMTFYRYTLMYKEQQING